MTIMAYTVPIAEEQYADVAIPPEPHGKTKTAHYAMYV